MSKQAWLSLPVLALCFAAFLGCPSASTDQPQQAATAPEGAEKPVMAKPEAASPTVKQAARADRNKKEADQPETDADDNDPVKRNGEIFVGWEKPKLAVVLTGEQLGYIEPCGCAGLENQKGGLRRRDTFLKLLAAQKWPTAALDNGGLIRRFGRQAEIKYEKTVEGLKIMNYRAVGFGADDLKLPTGSVVASVTNVDAFVSANVGLFLAPGEEGAFVPRYRILEVGGVKLGVTSVFGEAFQKQINNDEIKFLAPEVAIRQVLPELKKAACDLLVLLSYASREETEVLVEQFPEFGAVVTAGGADEPPYEPALAKNGKTLLIEVGHKGMYAIVLGLYDDEEQPLRYQRVPLDHRFKDSAEMDELMVNYQEQLKELGWAGLGLRPANHPRGKFIGSKACTDCHQDAFDVWEGTTHAHATETLTKVKPPRQFDPECVSCHVTGWNPQEFFPYVSGYEGLKTTPLLAGNGCENCHGPAAEHVAAENGDDEELQNPLPRGPQALARRQGRRRVRPPFLHGVPRHRQQSGLQLQRVLAEGGSLKPAIMARRRQGMGTANTH